MATIDKAVDLWDILTYSRNIYVPFFRQMYNEETVEFVSIFPQGEFIWY